ncbi:chromosome segregation protein SMC [Leptolyngbya sp. FACHB-261]|uniref:chromosome segregation protein SMC n=1 Tax=Leptolyngbya sp. FACHB-261 TaxID=2692806 RepID=UPI0016858D4B|nr:chromosome segregation protein SMC [Leptolyngbya sp. FACHB-261]MBD2099703.1 chromosome segregation protein SMC [Leptolyngbya sp. FACHB-261]
MYIKRLELTRFKSFGSTTVIPLLPGFTVVSGPNGSGKSNILDALLFALGLAGSKGMRAERLPDLVNNSQKSRSTVEASVKVTFDLEDGNDGEWSVTRKLRVTPQGTYTSTYAINDVPCTLTELHEQLAEHRIYPEGYNIVLQGDVTSIISMSSRERRQIIDELAGVAAFDRKIDQAKEKLDAVKEREDRFRIVEKELIAQRDRLAQDRIKAEKYRKLRAEIQAMEQWEVVLNGRQLQRQQTQLREQIRSCEQNRTELSTQLAELTINIARASAELEHANQRVKALGEDEQLALQSQKATREAELRAVTRSAQELSQAQKTDQNTLIHLQGEVQEHHGSLERLNDQFRGQIEQIEQLVARQQHQQQLLARSRESLQTIAESSNTSVQQQTQLRHQIDTLLSTLDPQRQEQTRLRERLSQLERQIQDQKTELARLDNDLIERQNLLREKQAESTDQQERVQSLAQSLTTAQQEGQTQQATRDRLSEEQTNRQRQLDRIEARAQAIQEVQGTYATRLILQMELPGVCGLVAQLGQVDPHYQLALSIAAGARLGHLVVEDDGVAAAGIELLRREKAGRLTFLPLNRIQPARSLPRLQANGAIDYALNLIQFDERYIDVFAYVFGNTVVFEHLSDARRYLNQYRMVTIDGELLESSGAMTGGSAQKNSLQFGTGSPAESDEAKALKERLQEIERLLKLINQKIQVAQANMTHQSEQLAESRARHRDAHSQIDPLTQAIASLNGQRDRLRQNLESNQQELQASRQRLSELDQNLPVQEADLQILRQELGLLEQSQDHSEWQQAQAAVSEQEVRLAELDVNLRSARDRQSDATTQAQVLQEKIKQSEARIQECRRRQTDQLNQQTQLTQQRQQLEATLAQLQQQLATLEVQLGSEKQLRDRLERQLREQTNARQELEWQLSRLQERQQEAQQQLESVQTSLQEYSQNLPDPEPEVPADLTLEQLASELRSRTRRLQAMEPVNMLAIEEYNRTQERLDDLSQKLTTLEEERTELLLRIENFTTLRLSAFKEAFDAVDKNFQVIFAELSDGDGHLQLENVADPFAGGLNLVAHPKGKPVQRLASMSGGEKSLTALSFIFALQLYRPSPFYSFDEVDMFLDGSNVERLSRMVRKQADSAQFIVVSLRRPMIEAAERTIGVTQARGAHTQVLGLKLRSG